MFDNPTYRHDISSAYMKKRSGQRMRLLANILNGTSTLTRKRELKEGWPDLVHYNERAPEPLRMEQNPPSIFNK